MSEDNSQDSQDSHDDTEEVEGKKEKIIGIDLGTSNSAAAILQGGKPENIPSAEGTTKYGKSFPSVVAFTEDGQRLVGQPAQRQAVKNPDRTITNVKRKMGTDHKYEINGEEYTPQQISAFILQKIKQDAEEYLGEEVNKAVITVPAYFDDNQRQATKDAGKIAGLEVERIINEPTAASLAYGIDKKEKEQNILVFDFGAGTLDVTILEFGDGVFEVQSTAGDTSLGGTDMDDKVVDWVIEKFKEEEGIDLTEDSQAMRRVREAAEEAKIELSSVPETDINLPFIASDGDESKNLEMTLSRAKLEELVDPIVKKTKEPMKQAIDDAGLEPSDVNRIILVGGPTRMPKVRDFVEDYIGKESERGIDPMECVSKGAAIQGGVLAGEVKDILLLDVTPLSLGIETLGGVFTKLIEKNTTIPTSKSKVFSTAEDNQTAVTIRVGQGERPMFEDNRMLGQFDLVGIPPAPKGVPKIEVTFDIDADGILNVTAEDKGTGKEQSIEITAPHKLDEEEVEEMKEEAEKHAEEDKKRKERIQTRNEAEQTIYQVENTLERFEGEVPDEEKQKIEDLLEDLEEAKEEEDVEEMKEKIKEVNEAVQEIGKQFYQQAQQAQQAAEGMSAEDMAGMQGGPQQQARAGAEDEDDVVDADYEEKEEE